MTRIGLALLALSVAALLHARDTVRYVHGRAVAPYAYTGDSCTVVVFGDSIEEIGAGAFAGSSLREVVIPPSVKLLGEYAFADCKVLARAELESEVEEVPTALFKGCRNLAEVSLPAAIRTIGEKAFYGTALTVLDLSGMENLDTIADWAFADCAALTELYLPRSLRYLGRGALSGCESLSAFNLPENVGTVEDYLFTGDSALDASMVLHDGITAIGDYALSGTSHGTTVTLPSDVEYVGTGAMERFSGMRRLDVTTLYQVPELGDSVWGGVDRSRVVLETSDELRDDFRVADQWKDFSIATSSMDDFTDVPLNVKLTGGILKIVSSTDISRVRVFDVYGMPLYAGTPRSEEAEIALTQQLREVYLVEIATSDGTVHKLKLTDNL